MTILFITLIIISDVITPAALIWSWFRWGRNAHLQSWSARFAFVGLVLATASACVAIAAFIYSNFIGGFPFYDPRLMRIMEWGWLLSSCAILFSLGGIWKESAIRWLSPTCAVGTLMFWPLAAAGE